MHISFKQFGSTVSMAAFLLACDPTQQQALNSSTRQVSGRSGSTGVQTSSDLSVDITIPSQWSNARDIPVSWTPIENASEYQMDLASDEGCSSVQQSLRTKNTSTHITDLAEGVWFLCLKWKVFPKLQEANSSGLRLVIDRQAPEIVADGIQTVASGQSPILSVTDAAPVTCEWSSTHEKLTITDGQTLTPKFVTPVAGTYFVLLSCVDAATNSSEQSFSLTLPATAVEESATPTPTPTETPAPLIPPTVNAGSDILKNQAATLSGTATGAQSYLWTQMSGPGTLSFTAATNLQTNVTASADGAYVIRLTATAANGLTAEDDMVLTWDTTAPTVSAGQDVVIGAATVLQGTASADAVSFAWKKVSGTGNITFSTATTLTPTVSASLDGTYVLELTATDAAGNSRSDQMQFQWLTSVPTVNVGPDLNVKASVSVVPTVSGATTYAWTKVSGTGTITFSAPSAKNTNITASADGTYVIRLTVTNAGGQTANDTLTLVWDTVAPTVNAGTDRSANASFTQTGTSTGGTTYAWSKVSGTGTITFGSANALATTILASADGSYTLRLTSTDAAGNTASDDMVLTWDTTPPNNVTSLTATPGEKSMALAWVDGGGSATSYLVLRSTSSITATPVRGTTYTLGGTLSGATVVGVGSAVTLADTGLTGGTTYYYKVFPADALKNYATGVQGSAAADFAKTLKATFASKSFLSTVGVMGLQNSGNYTYVCRGDAGSFRIVNTSNPSSPTVVSTPTIPSGGFCSDIKVSGNYAYVANWNKGLVTVDVTNPAAAVYKSEVTFTATYPASTVTLSGNYAYVAIQDQKDDGTGKGGFAIVNISNPASLSTVSTTLTGGHAASIAKIGNYIYVTHRDTGAFVGMKTYDVSNPASPQLVQTITRPNMEEIQVSGNYLYVAEGYEGVEIFDASNPASIVSKSLLVMPDAEAGYANSLGVSGNYVFVVDYDGPSMFVMDATSKTAPSIIRTYTTKNNYYPDYIHVSGAYAYISMESVADNDFTMGMEIVEIFTLSP